MARSKKSSLGAIRGKLLEERAALEEAGSVSEDSRKPVTLDQQSVGRLSRMDAMQVQAMAVASENRRRIRRQRIEAALRRMEEDEFGYCVTCGDEIEIDRLATDPSTPNCIVCAGAK